MRAAGASVSRKQKDKERTATVLPGEMNFMVALRASVTQRFCSFLFFWPLALIGFQPLHIYMMSGIHLFIAFLHHTEWIGKLGWFDFIFASPSNQIDWLTTHSTDGWR